MPFRNRLILLGLVLMEVCSPKAPLPPILRIIINTKDLREQSRVDGLESKANNTGTMFMIGTDGGKASGSENPSYTPCLRLRVVVRKHLVGHLGQIFLAENSAAPFEMKIKFRVKRHSERHNSLKQDAPSRPQKIRASVIQNFLHRDLVMNWRRCRRRGWRWWR